MGVEDPVVAALGYFIDLTVRAGLTGWVSRSLQAPVVCPEVPPCPQCPGFHIDSVHQICPERRDIEISVHIALLLTITPSLLLLLVGFFLGRCTVRQSQPLKAAARPASRVSSLKRRGAVSEIEEFGE